MSRLLTPLLVLAVTGLVIAGAPGAACADFCIQISGASCNLSGDLGFFRFKKKLPKNEKKFVALHGRACGVGPAYGTAVQNAEGTTVEIGATFFCDAEQGQFNVGFPPGSNIGATGSGYASYGSYGLVSSCDAAIVDCSLEP